MAFGLFICILFSQCSLTPYKNNYSRWTPVYLLDMLNLPTEAEGLFFDGFLLCSSKSWIVQWRLEDMATEKTVIKDSKGDGGIVCLPRKKASLIRWNLTRHVLSQITSAMRARACLVQVDDQCHDEAKPAAMKRDEKHVQDLIVYITENMTNPFDVDNHPRQLINISTGFHASHDIEDSLLKSVKTGRTKMKIFVESSVSTDKAGSFYHPIQISGLKTFEDMNPKVQLKCKSGQVEKGHLNPELVFRRALSLTKCIDDVSVETVLSYPICPIPTALFHDDGTMRKTNKSDLAHELENLVRSVPNIPPFDHSATVLIRDGMSLVQSFDVKRMSTFRDLAKSYIMQVQSCFRFTDKVVDVFDRYDTEHSITSAERHRRSATTTTQTVYHIAEGRTVQDWKKFLSSNKNKQVLITFLGDYLSSNLSDMFQEENKCLVLAGAFSNPEIVRQLSNEHVIDLPDLFCSHEKADTRILLHVIHSDKIFQQLNIRGRIIVKCSDTDVPVLCVHYFKVLVSTEQMWFLTGSTNFLRDCRRYRPIHELSKSLSPLLANILPAVHAFNWL
ncbi:unnamed protein product [Mytilus coruscus]|uniref:Uncharacterized protein n=1 Tax=Mytilus coruscus TaxID=42192 RepID=A0A6J7ZVR9_MYTCO|nr:unnamed protein product [Mytilus coruscus]